MTSLQRATHNLIKLLYKDRNTYHSPYGHPQVGFEHLDEAIEKNWATSKGDSGNDSYFLKITNYGIQCLEANPGNIYQGERNLKKQYAIQESERQQDKELQRRFWKYTPEIAFAGFVLSIISMLLNLYIWIAKL